MTKPQEEEEEKEEEEEEQPHMGVLERALSRRGSLGLPGEGDAPSARLAFDSKRLLPHVAEDALHEDVTASSSGAMANKLQANQENSRRSNTAAPAAESTAVKQEEEDEEEGEAPPPLQRGIVSMEGMSGGNRGMVAPDSSSDTVARPQWEINMQLDLREFDQASVSYLAEGAMCQCFLARRIPAVMNLPEDDSFQDTKKEGVVIKTPIDGGPEEAENDLVVESLVLRKLSHPNIISILGAGSTNTGASFIVLEFLAEGTLRGRLDKCGGGLGVQPAVKYGHQLSSALAYMHDDALPGMIIMHRDLKPDNIGFSSSGEAKLMDFGLSKVINRTVRCGSVKYNMTGETGSPRYMPPEVAKSMSYNEKADVWSFIIILWEMAAGRLPFAGMNMEMYLAQVCEGGNRPLIQNQWSADFKNLLKSGWQTEPDKRPSFREIHAVLTGSNRDMQKPKRKGLFGRG